MKFIIRNKRAKTYLSENDGWVKKKDRAEMMTGESVIKLVSEWARISTLSIEDLTIIAVKTEAEKRRETQEICDVLRENDKIHKEKESERRCREFTPIW